MMTTYTVTGKRALICALAGLGISACSTNSVRSDARVLHDELLVLDTHLDTPARLEYPDFDILQRHDATEHSSQVDLPRMVEGGLDGGFWVIFTRQGELTDEAYDEALQGALQRAAVIQRLVDSHPGVFEAAYRADDAAPIAARGARVVYQSIENAYPLGDDLSLLQTFYDLGVRMIGIVHSSNNQFADSSTDPAGPRWNGLSPAGRALVAEANRLGMIIDASHAHDIVLDELLELSATPLVLSHSGAKDVFDHPRNVDDKRLKKLANAGGVIQMNALGAYMKKIPGMAEHWAASSEIGERYPAPSAMTLAEARDYHQEQAELSARDQIGAADFEDYMSHFLHVLELVGPDHVGVGADWDGGGGVDGMEDIAYLPRITERLMAEGYTRAAIAKIWSGNVLRLLRQAEEHAASQGDQGGLQVF